MSTDYQLLLRQASVWNYLLRGQSLETRLEPNIRRDRSQGDPNLYLSSRPHRAQPLGNGQKGDVYILVLKYSPSAFLEKLQGSRVTW